MQQDCIANRNTTSYRTHVIRYNKSATTNTSDIESKINVNHVFFFVFRRIFSRIHIDARGKGYAGYSFNKSHGVFIENQQERYTPTKEDIVLAEKILKDISRMSWEDKNFSTSIYWQKICCKA